MLTKTVEAQETTLADLLSLAREGNEIIITKDDKPIAKLSPLSKKRIAGLHEGMMRMSDDFNNPLPDEFWLGKEWDCF
jgi:antitoxin (DNA-binding transcriptional repressor) of toxin-antitoxin stability system